MYPLVNKQFAIENDHRNSWFTHSKWWIFPVRYVNVYQAGYVVYIINNHGDLSNTTKSDNGMKPWNSVGTLLKWQSQESSHWVPDGQTPGMLHAIDIYIIDIYIYNSIYNEIYNYIILYIIYIYTITANKWYWNQHRDEISMPSGHQTWQTDANMFTPVRWNTSINGR
jgi:hypothetical protein